MTMLYALALWMCIPGTTECRYLNFPPARLEQCEAMKRLVLAEAREEGFTAHVVCSPVAQQEASN
jgi:hypothetical protein